MSLLSQAASSYQFYATNNPIVTNSVTGFLIASVGDLLCQRFLDSWEKKRVREAKIEQLTAVGKSAAKYFDDKELEKVRHSVKEMRAPLKSNDAVRGQTSETQTIVKRNAFQNLLSKSKPKTSQVVSVPPRSAAEEGKALRRLLKDEEKPFEWDSVRTIHLGIIRALVIAPFVQWWYPVMLRTIPGRSMKSVLGRVIMDQVSGSPLVVVMVFMASASLQGNPLSSIQRIKEIGFATWMRGLQFWPFVHAIMHRYIPIQHQTLFAHFCSLYWNAVLSYYVNLKMEK